MIRKISVQDVVSKRSVESEPARRERDFLIERLTRKHTTPSIAEAPVKAAKRSTSRTKKYNFKGFKIGNKWFWLGVPLLLIIVVLVVLQFMVSATLSVKAKEVTVPVDAKLFASLSASTSPSALMYQIIGLSTTDSEIATATGSVAVKPQKASGQITIYNGFSNTAQVLVQNTRFETSDGLIYRIPSTIKVPGFTVSAGKTIPGSLTVKVFADQVGSNYNIDLVDFTIPGFKTNADRYSKIFGRSKTPMTGGADANSVGVTSEARQAAEALIETRLKDSLLRQAQAQKTDNSVIFDSASKISFQHLPDTVGVDPQHIVIHEKGTISSIAFDKKVLGKVLLGDAVASVGNSAEIHGMDSLHFIAAVSSTSPAWDAKPFAFTLTGSVDVVGVIDSEKLMQSILGIHRSDLTKVLSDFPTIDKASASIKPFWKSTFPKSASNIKIEIVK